MVTQEEWIVSFDGCMIFYRIQSPEEPRAILIPVHGSFPQRSNGDVDEKLLWLFPEGIPRRNLFGDIASIAHNQGVATLTYDKRAAGKSEGVYCNTTLDDLARDLRVLFFRAKELFPSVPIILLGQSEGTLTIPRAIELGVTPQCVVLQGPLVEDPLDTFRGMKDRVAKPFLNDVDGSLAARFPYLSAIYKALFEGDYLEKIENTSERLYSLKPFGCDTFLNLELIRQYRRVNILEVIKSSTASFHFIVGSEDQNTPAEPVRKLFESEGLCGNPRLSLTVLDGLDHSFRKYCKSENFIDSMAKPLDGLYVETLKQIIQSVCNTSQSI